MKITKYVHSCLLVETSDRVGLIDPGQFSWESGLFNVASLDRLDDIIITHEHFDHMHTPFIKELIAKFPDVTITTTPHAAEQLRQAGITQVKTDTGGVVELFATDHESTEPLGQTPQHVGVHYSGALTHPGDSHHFNQCKDILALPVTGPWGSLMRAAQLGADLKPKHIIPIHDWHWNATARSQAHDRLEGFFGERGIHFIKPKDGESITF